MTKKPLHKRFPDSAFIARVKIWTPKRNVLELSGPYDDVSGELLAMIGAHAHPSGEKLKAMKRCLTALKRSE